MTLVLTVGIGLGLLYLGLLGTLLVARPKGNVLGETLRLLPDLLRLLRRLAGDSDVPRAVRVRLWLLLGYLAIPIDLVPDFVPVLGYADDAIVVALVLRTVLRSGGPDLLSEHWPGPSSSLEAVSRLAYGRRNRRRSDADAGRQRGGSPRRCRRRRMDQ